MDTTSLLLRLFAFRCELISIGEVAIHFKHIKLIARKEHMVFRVPILFEQKQFTNDDSVY